MQNFSSTEDAAAQPDVFDFDMHAIFIFYVYMCVRVGACPHFESVAVIYCFIHYLLLRSHCA